MPSVLKALSFNYLPGNIAWPADIAEKEKETHTSLVLVPLCVGHCECLLRH